MLRQLIMLDTLHKNNHTANNKALETAGIALALVVRVPAPLKSLADQAIRAASSVPANRSRTRTVNGESCSRFRRPKRCPQGAVGRRPAGSRGIGALPQNARADFLLRPVVGNQFLGTPALELGHARFPGREQGTIAISSKCLTAPVGKDERFVRDRQRNMKSLLTVGLEQG